MQQGISESAIGADNPITNDRRISKRSGWNVCTASDNAMSVLVFVRHMKSSLYDSIKAIRDLAIVEVSAIHRAKYDVGDDPEISGEQARRMKHFPLLEGCCSVFAFGYAGVVFLGWNVNPDKDQGRTGLPGDCC